MRMYVNEMQGSARSAAIRTSGDTAVTNLVNLRFYLLRIAALRLTQIVAFHWKLQDARPAFPGEQAEGTNIYVE